jgi:hypothetical protein
MISSAAAGAAGAGAIDIAASAGKSGPATALLRPS